MRILDIVEKPQPGGGAVEPGRDGPLRLHARDLRLLEQVQPGVGGEIQLTDAIGLLLAEQTVYGYTFTEGRYDTARSSTTCAPSSSSPSTATTSVPSSARCSSTSCVAAASWSRRASERCLAHRRWRSNDPRPAGRSAAAACSPSARRCIARAVPLGRRPRLRYVDALSADEAVPPFANTAMDGFAVRAADTAGRAGTPAASTGTLAAGGDPSTYAVTPGTAVRIMTGAPMPDGADAVVMVEHTTTDGDHVVVAGVGRRSATTCVRSATTSLPAMRCSRREPCSAPVTSACWPASGYADLPVFPRPRVGVLSTGDELVDGRARCGRARSATPTVTRCWRWSPSRGSIPVDLGLVRDDLDAITVAVERGCPTATRW